MKYLTSFGRGGPAPAGARGKNKKDRRFPVASPEKKQEALISQNKDAKGVDQLT